MNVACYFDDSKRFGNFTQRLKKSTNTHYAWCFRYAANANDPPEVWLPDLVKSCQRAFEAGRWIHLNIDLTWPTPIDMVFEALKPFRSKIVCVEIADEPKWNSAATTRHCKQVRSAMKKYGYSSSIPLMVMYKYTQLPWKAGKDKPWDAVDVIGVEAYLALPGDHNSPYNIEKLQDQLESQLAQIEKAHKRAIIANQSYSRNYAWRDIGHPDPLRWPPTESHLDPGSNAWKQAVKTMVDLQVVGFNAAKAHKSVDGLYFFSWARNSGAHGVVDWHPDQDEYPALATEVLRLGKKAVKL